MHLWGCTNDALSAISAIYNADSFAAAGQAADALTWYRL